MKKIREKILYTGKWIRMKAVDFAAKNGECYTWEMAERTRDEKGVVIVAELLPSQRIVFIRQYRQPLENYIIGFPAGLVEGEDIAENAVRELQEETGFYGKVKSVDPLTRSNPGILKDGAYTVLAEIDETDPRNLQLQQKLELAEEIEVFLVPKNKTRDFLLERYALGDELGIGVWYLFGCERF